MCVHPIVARYHLHSTLCSQPRAQCHLFHCRKAISNPLSISLSLLCLMSLLVWAHHLCPYQINIGILNALPTIFYRCTLASLLGLWLELEVMYTGCLQMTLETKMNLCRLGKDGEVQAESVQETQQIG